MSLRMRSTASALTAMLLAVSCSSDAEPATEQGPRIVERQPEGFEPIAPVVERRLTDVIGPQPRGTNLPTALGQRHVVVGDHHRVGRRAEHHTHERNVGTGGLGDDRQRDGGPSERLGIGHEHVEPVSLEPPRLRANRRIDPVFEVWRDVHHDLLIGPPYPSGASTIGPAWLPGDLRTPTIR